MIGPADRVQSGQGIPGIPTPMPTGTMSNRNRRSTTTSTIATRLISSTVPRGRSGLDWTSVAATRGLQNPMKTERPTREGSSGNTARMGFSPAPRCALCTTVVGCARSEFGSCRGSSTHRLAPAAEPLLVDLAPSESLFEDVEGLPAGTTPGVSACPDTEHDRDDPEQSHEAHADPHPLGHVTHHVLVCLPHVKVSQAMDADTRGTRRIRASTFLGWLVVGWRWGVLRTR